MPELVPRRKASTKARFAQVAAAVLSGMAAMFCLQNVIEFRREAALNAAPARVSAPSEPSAPEPDIALPQGVKRQAGPVPSSMLLKPEPGMAASPATVVGVSGEEAPPKFEAPEAPPPPVAKKKKKELPRLETRDMESKFASRAVRNDGRFSEIKRHREVENYEPPAFAPAPEKRAAPIEGSTGIKLLERESEPEHLKPAPIAQITVPERVFWTKERKLSVGIAIALFVFGIIYLIYASGIRNDAPAREEGEL
ncbi:MAG: hypothetical protein Q7J64_04785 [Elusimicrobiota bacterium]|nr:hypothetical protein [Elusimicrobiota bacterium]